MVQRYIYCRDKRNWRAKPERYQICKGTSKRAGHVSILDPWTQTWQHGFVSKDHLGYTYWSPRAGRWLFTGVVIAQRDVITGSKLKLGWNRISSIKRLPLRLQIEKGIKTENIIVGDLNKNNTGFEVIHLPFSGIHSHGSDILISRHKFDKNEFPLQSVIKSLCGIEVLGVYFDGKKKKPKLMYHSKKDFKKWREELVSYDVLPVLAWTIDKCCFYVILTENVLDLFFRMYKGELRQQKGYFPVEKLTPFAINSCVLFSAIELHEKTIKIIRQIKNGKPNIDSAGISRKEGFLNDNRDEYDDALRNLDES